MSVIIAIISPLTDTNFVKVSDLSHSEEVLYPTTFLFHFLYLVAKTSIFELYFNALPLGVEVIEQFADKSIIPTSDRDFSKNKQTQIPKKAIMKEVAIPRYLISRLNLLAETLEMNEKDTLEALFDWAEVSLSLADILEIEDLKPNVLYDRVEKLTTQAEQKEYSNPQDTSNDQEGLEENIPFDVESIRDLCSSVKQLSKIVAEQQLSNKGASTRNSRSNNTTNKTTKKNNLPKQPSSDNADVKKEKKPSPRTSVAEIHINYAIDQIIKFNEQEKTTHADKFRVGIGALRKLTGRGDEVIRRVLKNRKDELDEHHKKHQLGKYQNSKGKQAAPVEKVVFLDEEFLQNAIAAVWDSHSS